jgi:hypothetical protein
MFKTQAYDEKPDLTRSPVQVRHSAETCAECGRVLRLDRTMLISRSGRVRCALPCEIPAPVVPRATT